MLRVASVAPVQHARKEIKVSKRAVRQELHNDARSSSSTSFCHQSQFLLSTTLQSSSSLMCSHWYWAASRSTAVLLMRRDIAFITCAHAHATTGTTQPTSARRAKTAGTASAVVACGSEVRRMAGREGAAIGRATGEAIMKQLVGATSSISSSVAVRMAGPVQSHSASDDCEPGGLKVCRKASKWHGRGLG